MPDRRGRLPLDLLLKLKVRDGEEFLEFESNSWKGKGGRALVCSETDRKYFVEIAREAFRRGKLMMLALRFNGRPIAYKVNFLSGDGSFAFKIAFDEEYARYSPEIGRAHV